MDSAKQLLSNPPFFGQASTPSLAQSLAQQGQDVCSVPIEGSLVTQGGVNHSEIFFFFLAALRCTEFPGQGSDLSHSNLHHSCGNDGSFNPLHQLGEQTCFLVLQRYCQSIVPQQELLIQRFLKDLPHQESEQKERFFRKLLKSQKLNY